MTTAGWILMIVSWGILLTVGGLCYSRILSKKQRKKYEVPNLPAGED